MGNNEIMYKIKDDAKYFVNNNVCIQGVPKLAY
jgi:hypothetical protein